MLLAQLSLRECVSQSLFEFLDLGVTLFSTMWGNVGFLSLEPAWEMTSKLATMELQVGFESRPSSQLKSPLRRLRRDLPGGALRGAPLGFHGNRAGRCEGRRVLREFQPRHGGRGVFGGGGGAGFWGEVGLGGGLAREFVRDSGAWQGLGEGSVWEEGGELF